MDLIELANMQKQLDSFIAKEKGLGDPYNKKFLESRILALKVEIAELANATRCFKYWSNKGPESKERILDEAADVLHFILSIINLENTKTLKLEKTNNMISKGLDIKKESDYTVLREKLIIQFNLLFQYVEKEKWLIVIVELAYSILMMGFTLEELQEAYLKKHEENYKRQEQGY
ncbi:dUTP diphosphatase [Clostridium novyi]|uniref:dUTP diphosphatase n=1 Tax=Clostridium novyi TaxID=1542 RepID=UPI0004D5B79C|nr:dUTP diphosphatase [Clostridium novyi]KEH88862.1 putative DUTPase [Clostridium novyi A str. GD211209]